MRLIVNALISTARVACFAGVWSVLAAGASAATIASVSPQLSRIGRSSAISAGHFSDRLM